MKKAPIPKNDEARIKELEKYKLLDTDPEPVFDEITKLASEVIGSKYSCVNLIDKDRLWFKSHFGLEGNTCPRDISFCGHTINVDDIFIVSDVSKNKDFNDNPFHTDPPHVNFYAGVPLTTPAGFNVGSLCVFCDEPKELNEFQIKVLKSLAKQVVALMELRVRNEQLEELKQQSLDIQAMSHTGGWELNPATGETKWTDEVYEIHQIEKGTPTNKIDGISYYAEHERERITKFVTECITEKKSFDETFEFKDAKGTEKWVRSIGRPVLDKDGNVFKLVGTFQDVSEFKEKETELKDSKQYLDLALEGANLGVWDWYLEDNSVRFDKRWAEMLGLDIDKVKMELETWESRVHPDDLEKCYADIQAYMSGKKKQYQNIHRMKHEDGHWVYILDQGKFSDWDEDGKPTRFTGTHLDITESEHQKKKLKLFFENSTFGFAFCDMDGKLLEINDRYKEIVGYDSIEEVNKLTYWDLTPKKYEEQEGIQIESLTTTGKYGPYRKEYIRKDGSLIPVELNGFIVKDYDGVDGIWSIVEDISEKRVLEQQVNHTSKLAAIGELAAGVGHEINNPLAIIKGYVSTLKKKYTSAETFDPEGFFKYMDKLNIASDRIAKIVKGLRTFSRSDNNQVEDFDMKDALEESLMMVQEIYEHDNIVICIDSSLNKGEALIHGNRGRIQQVFMNLLSNAKDATYGKVERKIELKTQLTDEHFIFRVKDNGRGIPDEIIEKVFDPFFTTKEINKGTGIGLSLVHNIIMEHHGNIFVESKEDVGTTFTVKLPLSSATEEVLHSLQMDEPISSQIKANIILADDEDDIREFFSEMLEDLGVNVYPVKNGKVAYEMYTKNPSMYDLIISDMKMPEMDGPTLLKRIREDSKLQQPKFCIITGGINVNFESKSDALSRLIDGYFYKPFDEDRVKLVLSEILGDKFNKDAA